MRAGVSDINNVQVLSGLKEADQVADRVVDGIGVAADDDGSIGTGEGQGPALRERPRRQVGDGLVRDVVQIDLAGDIERDRVQPGDA